MSSDYFTERQDRYVLFRECGEIADYFFRLIRRLGDRHSLRLTPTDQLLPPQLEDHPGEDVLNRCGPKSSQFPDDWSSFLRPEKERQPDAASLDTRVYPLIQMPDFGVDLDFTATQQIMRLTCGRAGDEVRLATGYFNLVQEYQRTILRSYPRTGKLDILMAHPEVGAGFRSDFSPSAGEWIYGCEGAGGRDTVRVFPDSGQILPGGTEAGSEPASYVGVQEAGMDVSRERAVVGRGREAADAGWITEFRCVYENVFYH